MEEAPNPLIVLIDGHDLKPKGVRALVVKHKCFICLWNDKKIYIYCSTISENQEVINEHTEYDPLNGSEVNVKSCVVEVFQTNDDSICVLDDSGTVYSLQPNTSSLVNFMDVEDLFSSPTTTANIPQWTENIIRKINDFDIVKNVSLLSTSLAILAIKDENLMVFVYSLPEYGLKFVLDLKNYASKEAVLSSCDISTMSRTLKHHFKESLEVFDSEIIMIGLASGLILWFYANIPVRGPFVLFYAYQRVQSIHWIKDPVSGLYSHLLLLMSSGQVVIYGEEKHITLHLPDSVTSSCCLKNFIVTSNSVDCYASEIRIDKGVTLNCVTLPVKGVCAMTCVPGSCTLLIAATVHGSVYCFNATVTPTENPARFTLPDQSLLDNMFIQTQNLEKIYKQLNEEDDILKAVTSTIAANCSSDFFQTTLKVISDAVFSVTVMLTTDNVVFLRERWLVCVEVVDESGSKETTLYKMEQDFTNNKDLVVNVNRNLSVGNIVTIELVYFFENQQPLLIVPIGKVGIDPCYLMVSQVMAASASTIEESLENILNDLNNEPSKLTLQEYTLIVKLPDDCPVNSLFKTILENSKQRFSSEEWDKLSSGKKFNVRAHIGNSSVMLILEAEFKQLIITSSNTELCHKVKETVIKRLRSKVTKHIPESLTLDVQAVIQTFEIEILKEEPNFQSLDVLRKNIRSSISAQLLL